jgi:putative ATP-binding cassette transporter
MRLFKTVVRDIPENLKSLLLMNILSSIATMSFVALVSSATKVVAKNGVSVRLLLLFAITVMLFHLTHIYTLVTASQDAERLIHKIRVRLFDLVRRTDLVTIDKIGHAMLQGVLTQDTQVLVQILPMLVVGFQQLVMLLFLVFYLAWLSPLACVLAFGFSGMAVAIHFARVKALRASLQLAATAEARVFDGLTELLHGFKEVRMSWPRADGLVESLGEASHAARTTNIILKTRWGRNYAIIESMLFSLVGLMVFVVPLFISGFHSVVLPVTIAVLFISGTVGTMSFVTPLVAQAELALEHIETMQEKLAAAAEAAANETTGRLEKTISTIALNNAALSYRDKEGIPLFSVGPLTAEFHAGQITFITGGNGSGKSTLLRLITGLIPLDAGCVLADGLPLASEQMQDFRDKISAIFSDFHLSRRIYCISDSDPARITALLNRMEMHDKVTVSDGAFSTIDLSTGQRKRLALIVAELEDKPVIVLDEWAADQDPHFRRIFYEVLLPEFKARGKIIICVTHDDRWFHLADRMYHMDEGQIKEVLDR